MFIYIAIFEREIFCEYREAERPLSLGGCVCVCVDMELKRMLEWPVLTLHDSYEFATLEDYLFCHYLNITNILCAQNRYDKNGHNPLFDRGEHARSRVHEIESDPLQSKAQIEAQLNRGR